MDGLKFLDSEDEELIDVPAALDADVKGALGDPSEEDTGLEL